MLKSKKNLFNVVFVIVVFVFTIYSIFHGEDLSNIFSKVVNASPGYLLLGCFCVVLFIYLESYIIHYMLGSLDIKKNQVTCLFYSCIGFFFSCITPSASGGQPAQIYYMKKDKIPMPVSTVVMMIVTITYKSVLVVVGLFLLFFQQRFIQKYLNGILPLFILGFVMNIFSVTSMMLLTFDKILAKKIVMTGLNILVKLKFLRYRPKRVDKLSDSMDSYNVTAQYLRENKIVILKVFIITFIQRFVLFFIAYFTYKSFGLKGVSVYDIVMLQAVISVSVDMLPLPGGMGVSEGLFLSIFLPVFGPELIMPGMIISRGLSYYTQLILSALMTCIGHILVFKNNNKSKLEKDTIKTIECKH